MENLSIENLKINGYVKEYVEMALKNDYKVYGFQKNEEITQVFIESSKGICTIHNSSFEISVSSEHKPCPQCGTGFGLGSLPPTKENIDFACSIIAPSWARNDFKHVVKWKSFEEKAETSILNYFEIISK